MGPHGPARRRPERLGSAADLDRRVVPRGILAGRNSTKLALVAAIAMTACGAVAPSLPADGLTSARAIEMAQPTAQSMSTTPVEFMSEKTGQYRDFAGGGLAVTGDRWVWSVVFKGSFRPASNGPAPAPGQTRSPLPDQHSVLVIIDYRTGEFIQASIPGLYVPNY
jgi:hypothetical protein